MSSKATITFFQEGVQPPVYVVTSLSEPPWEPLEMHVDKQDAQGQNQVFSRSFDNVAEGTYQYKIRIGEGHWVVDDSKQSATDEHGNKNNVIHVKPLQGARPVDSPPDDQSPDSKSVRKDSTIDEDKSAVPSVPVPFVVVEKVPDKEQPERGDAEPSSLPVDEAKRAADPEPDLEKMKDDEGPKTGSQELDAAPLLRHESAQAENTLAAHTINGSPIESSVDQVPTPSVGQTVRAGDELESAPLLPYEVEDVEDADELNQAPLLAHESDTGGDELDAAPLLSHETGFSQKSNTHVSDPQQSVFDAEYDSDDYDPEDDAPLLPHERESAGLGQTESDHGDEDLHLRRKSSHRLAFDNEKHIFGQPTTFRTRNNSSTLPHRMPQSDADDDNLHDPSLEHFPTERTHILERVASIGLQLPEDQTIEDAVHSPVVSVFSQSASSVDLAPVKSYASLASVPEGDDIDEDAEADMESLPSPAVLSFPRSSSRFARSPNRATPSDDEKGIKVSGQGSASDLYAQSSDAESIDKHDFAKDKTSEAVQKALKSSPKAPTSEPKAASTHSKQERVGEDGSHLQDENTHNVDESAVSPDGDESGSARSVNPPPSQPLSKQLQADKHDETFRQSFVTAWMNDQKRARIAVIVVGIAMAIYWFLG